MRYQDIMSANDVVSNFFFNIFYKTLQNRADYYRYVNKYLNGHMFVIDKQIGSKSKTSKIYACNAGGCWRGLLKFACKKGAAKKDIRLSIKLSALVLRGINPHFNIAYRYIKEGNLLCELAKGDLKMFIKGYIRYDVLVNCLEQILLSVLSFHVHTGLKHTDCYHGNFLYHRIAKDAKGICYNVDGVDICIKNVGYLWMINDFDLVCEVDDAQELYQDYLDAIEAFENYKRNKKFNLVMEKVLGIIRLENNGYDLIKRLHSETDLFNYRNKVNNYKYIL